MTSSTMFRYTPSNPPPLRHDFPSSRFKLPLRRVPVYLWGALADLDFMLHHVKKAGSRTEDPDVADVIVVSHRNPQLADWYAAQLPPKLRAKVIYFDWVLHCQRNQFLVSRGAYWVVPRHEKAVVDESRDPRLRGTASDEDREYAERLRAHIAGPTFEEWASSRPFYGVEMPSEGLRSGKAGDQKQILPTEGVKMEPNDSKPTDAAQPVWPPLPVSYDGESLFEGMKIWVQGESLKREAIEGRIREHGGITTDNIHLATTVLIPPPSPHGLKHGVSEAMRRCQSRDPRLKKCRAVAERWVTDCIDFQERLNTDAYLVDEPISKEFWERMEVLDPFTLVRDLDAEQGDVSINRTTVKGPSAEQAIRFHPTYTNPSNHGPGTTQSQPSTHQKQIRSQATIAQLGPQPVSTKFTAVKSTTSDTSVSTEAISAKPVTKAMNSIPAAPFKIAEPPNSSIPRTKRSLDRLPAAPFKMAAQQCNPAKRTAGNLRQIPNDTPSMRPLGQPKGDGDRFALPDSRVECPIAVAGTYENPVRVDSPTPPPEDAGARSADPTRMTNSTHVPKSITPAPASEGTELGIGRDSDNMVSLSLGHAVNITCELDLSDEDLDIFGSDYEEEEAGAGEIKGPQDGVAAGIPQPNDKSRFWPWESSGLLPTVTDEDEHSSFEASMATIDMTDFVSLTTHEATAHHLWDEESDHSPLPSASVSQTSTPSQSPKLLTPPLSCEAASPPVALLKTLAAGSPSCSKRLRSVEAEDEDDGISPENPVGTCFAVESTEKTGHVCLTKGDDGTVHTRYNNPSLPNSKTFKIQSASAYTYANITTRTIPSCTLRMQVLPKDRDKYDEMVRLLQEKVDSAQGFVRGHGLFRWLAENKLSVAIYTRYRLQIRAAVKGLPTTRGGVKEG